MRFQNFSQSFLLHVLEINFLQTLLITKIYLETKMPLIEPQ